VNVGAFCCTWLTELLSPQSLTLVQMLSFIFLGDGFVLTAASAFDPDDDMRPTLLLYDLNPGPSRSAINPDAYLLRFLFQTPPPAQGSPAIFLTSDPSPDWSSSPDLHVPFQIPCDERIIAINLHRFYLGDSRSESGKNGVRHALNPFAITADGLHTHASCLECVMSCPWPQFATTGA
jgi:hypothetical protein